MKNSFIKKSIIFLVALMLIFGGIDVLKPPKKAEAVWGAADVVVDPALIGTTVANWGVQFANWAKEELVKAIRDAIVKRLIDYMTDQTIAWINGGGTPQFISDWQGFLRQVANTVVGDVVMKTNAAFLCSPFKFQVALALLPVPKYTQSIGCTFDKIVGNMDAFYKDFKQGSWLGYTTAWAPENNYYGTMIRVHDEITQRTAESQTSAQNQGISDKGFLPVQTCTQWDTSAAANTCADVFESCKAQGSSDEECMNLSQTCTEQNRTCTKKETKTPGDIVGTAVRTAINSDQQWVVNVQSAVSAIVNALINKLITKGLVAAVGSANDVGSKSGGDYTAAYKGALSQASNFNKNQVLKQMNEAVAEWQALLADKTLSLASASSTLESLNNSSAGTCNIGSSEDPEILPPLTASDIQKAQANVDRLKMEVDVLKGKITDVSGMISRISNADLSELSQQSDIQNDIMRFIDDYDTDRSIGARLSGEDRQAASAERAAMQKAAQEAESRSRRCPLQIQSAPVQI